MSKMPTYSDGTSEKASQTWKFRFEGSQPGAGKLLDVMSKPISSVLSDGRERASSRSQALRDRRQDQWNEGSCISTCPFPAATSAILSGPEVLVSILGCKAYPSW